MPTKPTTPPDDTPAANETTTTASAGQDPAKSAAPAPAAEPAKAAAKETAKDSAKTAAEPEPEVPEGRLPAGTYEFTYTVATHYLEVPLTARPADPGRPPVGDDPDADDYDPGAPETAATVFHWPFSAPDDGRWAPTDKKPNQVADNAPPVSDEE